jgi:hypothetical protein
MRDLIRTMARRGGILVAGWMIFVLAGCAPRVVPVADLTVGPRSQRYREALAQRETRGVAVDASLLLWAEVPADSKLPGAEGRLLLAGPDAFRLRVGSLFGTALDVGGRGDSVRAYLPRQRLGMALDARTDTLGFVRPGSLAFRAMSAAWRPPETAWEQTTWQDTLLRVWWLENGDTVAVEVGSNGLPHRASVTRAGMGTVLLTYRLWDRNAGTAWPAVVGIEDSDGDFRLTCKIAHIAFHSHADPALMAVPIPSGAERLTVARLRRQLERMGER